MSWMVKRKIYQSWILLFQGWSGVPWSSFSSMAPVYCPGHQGHLGQTPSLTFYDLSLFLEKKVKLCYPTLPKTSKTLVILIIWVYLWWQFNGDTLQIQCLVNSKFSWKFRRQQTYKTKPQIYLPAKYMYFSMEILQKVHDVKWVWFTVTHCQNSVLQNIIY